MRNRARRLVVGFTLLTACAASGQDDVPRPPTTRPAGAASRPADVRPSPAALAAELRNDQIDWVVYMQKDDTFKVDGHYPPYIADPGRPLPRKRTPAAAFEPGAGFTFAEVRGPLLAALDREDAWVAAHVMLTRHLDHLLAPTEGVEWVACQWDDLKDPEHRRNGTPERGALPAWFLGLRLELRVPPDNGGWSDNIDLPTVPAIDASQHRSIRAFWRRLLRWQAWVPPAAG